jgi:calcium uniporter protein, mitochondrial
VADIVIRALPDTVAEANARIEEISAQLAPLEVQRAQIDRQARLWRGLVAWSGLGLMIAQFAIFARLTYWELSWDVMEPVSYFAGQLVVRAAFLGLTKDQVLRQHSTFAQFWQAM